MGKHLMLVVLKIRTVGVSLEQLTFTGAKREQGNSHTAGPV